jgi:hypothetical protein
MSKKLRSGYALHCRTKFQATPMCTGIFYVNYWYMCIVTGFIYYELQQIEIGCVL